MLLPLKYKSDLNFRSLVFAASSDERAGLKRVNCILCNVDDADNFSLAQHFQIRLNSSAVRR